MKKFKRMMALVMCLTLVLTFAMSASAESADDEAGTYGFVSPCLNCGTPISHNITREPAGQVTQACVHGIQGGTDLCQRYKVVDNYSCPQCGRKGSDESYQYEVIQCLH